MITQAQSTEWRNAVDDALSALNRVERYQRQQWKMRHGIGVEERTPSPGPRQFDESGFPIPQPTPRFVQRVGRLISR